MFLHKKYNPFIISALFFFLLYGNNSYGLSYEMENKDKSTYHENITLVIDRNLYLCDEQIWFYARLNSNEKHTLSKTIYIELYNSENSIQKKFSIEKGFCEGSISIPQDFESGGYLLRAYTNYMKNFLPEHYSYQVLTIINTEKGIKQTGKYDLDGENPKDSIIEDNTLLPNIYCSTIVNKTNPLKSSTFDYRSGSYKLVFQSKISGLKNNQLTIICRNSEFTEIIHEEIVGNDVLIPRTRLTEGINYLAVYKDSTPLIAGCIFEQNETANNLKLTTNSNTYLPRENVTLSFTANSKHFQKKQGIISAVRQGTVFQASDSTLISKLIALNPYLLNNYQQIFPGFGNLQDYYLKIALKNQVKLLIDNSNLLDKMINFNINFIPEIYDLSISGLVQSKSNKKPLKDCQVLMSVFGENPQIHTYKTLEDGSFVLNIENASGIQDVYLTTNTNHHADAEIRIINDFSRDFYPGKIPMLIKQSDEELLNQMNIALQIQKQFNTSDTSMVQTFEPLPVIHEKAEVLLLKDYIELPTMAEVLRSLVQNVYVRKQNGKDKIMVFDKKRLLVYKNPLILLDNIPVLDDQAILAIKPSKIEKIYVMDEPYYIGENEFEGIVSIHTKTHDFGGVKFNGSSVFLKYQTYTPESKLIKRNFATSNLPYFTNLLYWKTTNVDELSNVFQTNDGCGEYEIRLRIIGDNPRENYFGKSNIKISKTINPLQ